MVPHTSRSQRTATADRILSPDFTVFDAYLCMLPMDCFMACHTIECVMNPRFGRYVHRYSGVNRAKKIENFKNIFMMKGKLQYEKR